MRYPVYGAPGCCGTMVHRVNGVPVPCMSADDVRTMRGMCLHEHPVGDWMCARHRRMQLVCGTCIFMEPELRHDCPITLTECTEDEMMEVLGHQQRKR